MADMGLGVVGQREVTFRRKFRWMFEIEGIVGQELPMLPPLKSARPSISIKEMEVRHLDEVVFYPGRQDWKTINLTLYHVQCQNNPIYEWLKTLYDPTDAEDPFKCGLISDLTRSQKAVLRDIGLLKDTDIQRSEFIKRNANCTLYNGCGDIMEEWTYECVWPTSIDWGELHMESSDIVFVDLTLRYARAFVN